MDGWRKYKEKKLAKQVQLYWETATDTIVELHNDMSRYSELIHKLKVQINDQKKVNFYYVQRKLNSRRSRYFGASPVLPPSNCINIFKRFFFFYQQK